MRAGAIAEYHELLAADESLTPEFFARLKDLMSARRMVYGDRHIGVALRPYLLTREQYDRLTFAAQTLARAFEKVGTALLSDPALLDRVGLTEMERRLALVNPGFASSAVTTRLDAFVSGEAIRFVEYNAENPSSLLDQSELNHVLFEVRALCGIAERYRLSQPDPTERLLRALLATYAEWGGAGNPNVAIVDWPGLPTENEFILIRNYFVARGVPTIICTPDELEYDGDSLRRGDFRIDLVYKRVIIHELLARYDESHALMRAYAGGKVCLVNPFRCKILHKKAAFEFLTDEERQSWFTPAEREVLRDCVPWTRRFEERRTSFRGRSIELTEFVRRNRADFVLKPNDDYGGHGVFIGKSSGEAEWDDCISKALAGDYVVQELIELHTEEFPVFDDERWGLQQMYVDVNPFLFRGEMGGALVRLSTSPIVNVTSGGGETGFFVLEERLSTIKQD
ncbi:MAG: circularly permuted type 2 ATP-grasp protein [Acidobacteria bacterium]|nr:circularly permuted type 2 ATP-grasp protein [Acidobacteriota bacterium]